MTFSQQLGPQLPDAEPVAELPHKEAAVLKGHDGPVYAVRFNNTGTYCLTCGKVKVLPAIFYLCPWKICTGAIWCNTTKQTMESTQRHLNKNIHR